MGKTGAFFPQQVLDRWVLRGEVEFAPGLLTLRKERRQYRLTEAARIVAEVSGTPDPFDITGKVKALGFLHELGASLLGESMIIGENAYQIVPGWLGFPIGSFEEYRKQRAQDSRPSSPSGLGGAGSDEELLTRVVARSP